MGLLKGSENSKVQIHLLFKKSRLVNYKHFFFIQNQGLGDFRKNPAFDWL